MELGYLTPSVARRYLEYEASARSLLGFFRSAVYCPYGFQYGSFSVVLFFLGGTFQSRGQGMCVFCSYLFRAYVRILLGVLPRDVSIQGMIRASFGT